MCGGVTISEFSGADSRDRVCNVGRGAAKAEDEGHLPTHSHTTPSILVYEDYVIAKVNDPVHFTGANSGDLQREDPRPDPTLLGEPQGHSRQNPYISRQSTTNFPPKYHYAPAKISCDILACSHQSPIVIVTLETYNEKVCALLQPSLDNSKVAPAKIPYSPSWAKTINVRQRWTESLTVSFFSNARVERWWSSVEGDLVSQNLFINQFDRVNSLTKLATHVYHC